MKYIITVFFAIFLSSCSTLNTGFNKLGYQKIDEANAKIAKIENDKIEKIKAIETGVSAAKDAIIQKQNEQMQNAANYLYLANYAFSFYVTPSRLDYIINNNVKSASVFLPSPTYEYILKANEELKKELDESKTTLQDLRDKLNQAQIQAESLKMQITQNQRVIEDSQKNINNIKDTADNQIKTINADKDKQVKSELDKLQNKLNNAFNAQRQKLLIYIISICLIVGLVSGAVAIYLPIVRRGASVFSAICLLIAVGIPFITPLMVCIVFVIGILFLIYELAAKLHLTTKISDNLIRTVQRVKTNAPEVYDATIKPILADENAKYVKIKGEIKQITDTAVEKHIDSKLAEMNLK